MRFALGIEYDGTEFCGWQTQAHASSVQACVEQALSRVANHAIKVHCAGRTDAGVHALGQVVHFDSDAPRCPRAWVFGGNVNLPRTVAITWAQEVSESFHARFSARRRTYRYIILNRPARPGLFASRVTWECRPLDAELMNRAAQRLLGEHDFSAFRAQGCQAKHPIRTLYNISVRRQDVWLILEVEANAFLHHMVRNVAGVLLAVGRHEAEPEWVSQVLEGRCRAEGGITAPAAGLYLTQVCYDDVTFPEPTAFPALM